MVIGLWNLDNNIFERTIIITSRLARMDHKKRFRLLGGLIFLIVLLELLGFNRQYISQKFSGLEQRRLHVSDGTLRQYIYKNDILIPQGTNPSIRFENVDMRIMSISIKCQHTLPANSGRVFYRDNDQPFVSDLRITLSDLKNDGLRCSEFVINPYSQLRITLARLTLYLCVLALA